ncbi:uncharacterized protein LOC124541113 [Vanessa cardui]|uniref:uncharacterized protein LOC124541113 n=1 Tax=Vanessa cardui TaxID=171605 RepID=UPI001F14687B|nr:uncharacterized protein LOC124541113 [Vanessa cardui]
MILYQNYEVIISVYIYLIVKIICKIVEKRRGSMFNKQPTLTSIPEQIERNEETLKWVPKKKHEVLKAKYKCLKKLFQIYDASVIGILPQNYTDQQPHDEITHRRKRSHRTKTDACAGTTEISSGDILENEAVTVMNELKLSRNSSSQIIKSNTTLSNARDDKSTQDSNDSSVGDASDIHYAQNLIHRKKPTRFQIFLQRILGIRAKSYPYGGSDNNITRFERRRRNRLQFRRFRRPRKTNSDIALRDSKGPIILSYVQSIQRSYLTDTTPRHCPMVGCKMISYGIINYNDHLNLCHFPDRKFICHYCHEGFTKEYDKVLHENEHIGITKFNAQVTSAPSTARYTTKIASNTQTDPEVQKSDVPEEKLKKIVSFFDKISDPEHVLAEIKNSSSGQNFQTFHPYTKTTDNESDTTKSDSSSNQKTITEKKGYSSSHFQNKESKTSLDSDSTTKYLPVRCQLCGEIFEHRRQLNLHVDLEHRINDKFSKFHSCAGILNHNRKTDNLLHNVKSLSTSTDNAESTNKSVDNLSYDPSTNIVYFTSTESVDKNSDKRNIVQNVQNGFCYKWEPCTSVVRI